MTTGFLPDRGAHRSGLSIKSTHGRFQLRSLPQKRCAATLWTARLTTIFCSTIRYLRFPCLHASAFHLLPYLSARLSYPPLPPSFFPSFLSFFYFLFFFSLSLPLLSYRSPSISTPTANPLSSSTTLPSRDVALLFILFFSSSKHAFYL